MAIRFIPIESEKTKKPKVTVAAQPGVEVSVGERLIKAAKEAQSIAKGERHSVAQKALETAERVTPDPECSDPECGYRKIVEAQRAKHRDRVKKWRKK